MENWKPIFIDEIETNYSISDLGNVRNNKTGKLLSQRTQQGYKHVTLALGNKKVKSCRVHRLVAIAFIDNPKNKPYVNHIDCDRSNNKVSNLEWCTRRENVLHSYKLGLKKSIQEYMKIKRMKEVSINGRYK